MAIARIDGTMLKANLLRQGVDFAVETDLLYFDVGNGRIGIQTSGPSQALHVIGGITVDNLSFTTNTITSLDTDGDINLDPDGTGVVSITGDLTITGTVDGVDIAARDHAQSHAITSTSDHTATAWRTFYSNASGDIIELTFGGAGTVLTSGGASSVPTWGTPGVGGDVIKVGTPVDNELGVWRGDGTLEGDTNLTWNGSTLTVAGLLQTEASDASSTGFNIPPGTAPSSPDDGDIWLTASDILARVNGVTESLLAANAALGELSDVTFVTEVDGEILRFNGSDWINNTLNEASIPRMTVSGSEPGSPNEGDYWLNSGTAEVSIYANATWEPITYKTELADDAGGLSVNGGFF